MRSDPSDWPEGVEQVSFNDIGRFGINRKNELFWDGRRLVTQSRIRLSLFQGALALAATIATIIGGINNAASFLCARDIHWLTCPSPTISASAPAPSTGPPAAR